MIGWLGWVGPVVGFSYAGTNLGLLLWARRGPGRTARSLRWMMIALQFACVACAAATGLCLVFGSWIAMAGNAVCGLVAFAFLELFRAFMRATEAHFDR